MDAPSAAAPPAGPALEPARGWSAGFLNLLHKENGQWWRTRRWAVHLAGWLLLLDGFNAFVASQSAHDAGATAASLLQDGVRVLFKLGGLATAAGVVLGTQGALIGERRSGTAAWVLSKPVSRGAFVLSKLVASALAYLALAVLAPSLVFWVGTRLLFSAALSPSAFAAALGVWAVHLLFYLSLALMLGALLHRRGPLAGIALATAAAGFPLVDLAPALARVMPWRLPDTATLLALGMAPPPDWPVPLACSALWAAAFLGVALWRFGREEL